MEDQYNEQKESKFSFAKLMLGAAIVVAAGSGAYMGLKTFNQNNPDFHSSETTQLEIAKACTVNAVKILDGLSTRSLANGNYNYQTKQDAKAIQDILEPLKTNGSGNFDLRNPNTEDLHKIFKACATDEGYLATVEKTGEYLVKSHASSEKMKYEQDETAALKINVKNMKTEENNNTLVVSYKMR